MPLTHGLDRVENPSYPQSPGGYADLIRKADLCSAALAEAQRLAEAAASASLFAQLMRRIVDMLDQLDEALLAIDVQNYPGTRECVARLHAGYEELERHQARPGC